MSQLKKELYEHGVRWVCNMLAEVRTEFAEDFPETREDINEAILILHNIRHTLIHKDKNDASKNNRRKQSDRNATKKG